MASEFLLLQCWFYISFLAVFANLFVNQKRFRETFRIDDNVSGMITLNSAPIWAKILFAKVYFFHLHFYSLAVYNVLVIHIFSSGAAQFVCNYWKHMLRQWLSTLNVTIVFTAARRNNDGSQSVAYWTAQQLYAAAPMMFLPPLVITWQQVLAT